jgi:hypothetical protein
MQTYSHSGSVPISGALLTLFAGGTAGVVCGLIYGFAFYWVPWIYLNFVLMLLFAGAIGLAVATGGLLGKVRNNVFIAVAAVISTLVGMYFYWGAYFVALVGFDEVGLFAFTPIVLMVFAAELFENGSWGLKDGAPITGWFLVALWLIETGIIFTTSLVVSMAHAARPFCERCYEWTEEQQGVARLAATGAEPAWQAVLSGDLPSLAAFPPADPFATQFARLDVARCPRCQESRFLTIQSVEKTTDSKGNESEKTTALVTNAILTPAQFAVVEACGMLYENRLNQVEADTEDLPAENGQAQENAHAREAGS